MAVQLMLLVAMYSVAVDISYYLAEIQLVIILVDDMF